MAKNLPFSLIKATFLTKVKMNLASETRNKMRPLKRDYAIIGIIAPEMILNNSVRIEIQRIGSDAIIMKLTL
ncbi:MAG: hypothetical protein DRO88_05655 [Promethearchaeia archaeon]|nr:MAG: hypothetical protein DRO88_05655 [Candidatus Lokiarchaeia archaeon]